MDKNEDYPPPLIIPRARASCLSRPRCETVSLAGADPRDKPRTAGVIYDEG